MAIPHSYLSLIFFLEMKGAEAAILATNPCLFRELLIVLKETLFGLSAFDLHISLVDNLLFFNTANRIFFSYSDVNFKGLPLFSIVLRFPF